MSKKQYSINGPAGTMFESIVPQTRFLLPAKLGGGPVDLASLSLHDAANLYQNGWDILVKKQITPKEKSERPDSPESKKTNPKK
jgi:hypothetical protein